MQDQVDQKHGLDDWTRAMKSSKTNEPVCSDHTICLILNTNEHQKQECTKMHADEPKSFWEDVLLSDEMKLEPLTFQMSSVFTEGKN